MENLFIKTLKEEHARFVKLRAAKETAQRASDLNVFSKANNQAEEEIVNVANDCDNINRWTDESEYAKQYYGNVFAETTRFDSEWD